MRHKMPTFMSAPTRKALALGTLRGGETFACTQNVSFVTQMMSFIIHCGQFHLAV
jgi:hypothetical protein